LESVQQDAISRCGHLEQHDIGRCEMWAWAGEFLSISFKVLASLMSLHQGVAWFTCMQNEGALRMLGKSSTRSHLEMYGHLDHHDIGTI
jgi:hypothetical protein